MADPFLSEIRLFSFKFAPKGWALCDGQLLLINQNQALFAFLGTTFGGNGRTDFALPDLRGRLPIHVGAGHTLGERGGAEAHALSLPELPEHTHTVQGANVAASTDSPENNVPARVAWYNAPANLVAMNAGSVTSVGGSQAHKNQMPYLVLNFCIALQGSLPSPN